MSWSFRRIGYIISFEEIKILELKVKGSTSLQFDNSTKDCLINERVQKRKLDKTHCVVMYEGIEFDLVDFSLSRMRQVMMECGAACTIERRNDSYSFMANIVEQLNQDGIEKLNTSWGLRKKSLKKLKEDRENLQKNKNTLVLNVFLTDYF